jgi:hypothetical protein
MGGSTIFIFAGLGGEERERFLHHEGELQQKSSASLAHPATELLIMGMQVLAMVKIK